MTKLAEAGQIHFVGESGGSRILPPWTPPCHGSAGGWPSFGRHYARHSRQLGNRSTAAAERRKGKEKNTGKRKLRRRERETAEEKRARRDVGAGAGAGAAAAAAERPRERGTGRTGGTSG